MNPFETLTQINLDDLVSSFGWENYPVAARVLRRLFRKPSQTFADHMVEFDEVTGRQGLPAGGKNLLNRYVREIQIFGRENIPSGPFLALSNHPGLTDTVALFAALGRKDLHIIALDRPFLTALPNISNQLFYVYDEPAKRVGLVRQVSSHLRAGGSILTFPAGHIEPDPDVHNGAVESLESWTDSVGVFIRMVPQTAVLPVLVRGVISSKLSKHWFLNLRKTREDKERLAAALQLLGMVMFGQRPVSVRVQIGRPIYTKDLHATNTQTIHQAVLDEMKKLILDPPQAGGVHLL